MYPLLFTPLKVGGTWLKNRLVIPAMYTGLASPEGFVTPSLLNYYSMRARGGPGLVIVEVASIQPPVSRQGPYELSIDDDRFIPGLSLLAEAIHHEGARCFLQLFHSGAQTNRFVTGGLSPVAPSCPRQELENDCRELATAEVEEIIERFAMGAQRAFAAGFDGVELHAAHGYLLSQFLSPLTNHRSDRFGGSLENRARIVVEIVQLIRDRIPQLTVSVRMNGDDFVPGGLTVTDAEAMAAMLEDAGAHVLNISAGTYKSGLTSIESNAYPEGWRLYLAKTIRRRVRIPVMGGGVLFSPAHVERALHEGILDLAYVGRATLADPEWGLKAQAGQETDIRPCIRCNSCIARDFAGKPIRCAVNPMVGRDDLTKDLQAKAERPRFITVVGAGPAGLSAALAAADRGHRVVLLEKECRPGGLLNAAAVPPHKKRLELWVAYMVARLQQAGVDIRLGQPATPDLIRDLSPDALVLAVGGRPRIPELDDDESVRVIPAVEVLLSSLPSPGPFVIAGGGETGLETAQVLALRGQKVTVVEQGPTLAPHMERKNRRSLIDAVRVAGIEVLTLTTVAAIKDGRVIVTCDGGNLALEAGTLVLAAGYMPADIHPAWFSSCPEVHVIGDAASPASVYAAVFSGTATGAAL